MRVRGPYSAPVFVYHLSYSALLNMFHEVFSIVGPEVWLFDHWLLVQELKISCTFGQLDKHCFLFIYFSHDLSIGILDIFGFENFPKNSFEQVKQQQKSYFVASIQKFCNLYISPFKKDSVNKCLIIGRVQLTVSSNMINFKSTSYFFSNLLSVKS